jgi:hypothetical protein
VAVGGDGSPIAGWCNSGHGMSPLAAKRSAVHYWMKWLEAAALRLNIAQLTKAAGGPLRTALHPKLTAHLLERGSRTPQSNHHS